MNDINITIGDYHTITFESTEILSRFRGLFINIFNNRKSSVCTYMKIVDDRGQELNNKNFYFISFDCNVINLKEDRNSKKTIQDLLFYYLENNSDLLREYMLFNENIEKFLSQIEIKSGNLLIDFHSTDKTISNFIKSLEISIEYNDDEYVPNYIMREFLIKALLSMNVHNKNVILLLSYPETDVGYKDINKVISFLKGLNITTIVITSNYEFLSAASEQNMFLINKNGEPYDIIGLKKELKAFNFVEDESLSIVSKELAYRDFKHDYSLLDQEIKQFILSDRI